MKQSFIGIVGYQGAGKSTFCKKVLSRFKELNYIRTDAIREFLISNISYYNDVKYSYHTKEIDSANVSVKNLVESLIDELIKSDQSIVLDSIGRNPDKWQKYYEIVDNAKKGVQKIIVFIDVEKDVVIKRLEIRDKENPGNRWVESFTTKWSKEFVRPKESDADHLFIIKEDNDEEILDRLSKILE